MKFNFTKLAFPALLTAAAGVSAFADGPITLADGKTTVTWVEFANAINNPASIAGSADSTDLHTARVAYLGENGKGDTAGAKYEAAQAAKRVTEAQTAYDGAKHNQDLWTSQVVSLQADRSELQEQRNTLQNTTLPNLQKQLAAKQTERDNKLAELTATPKANLKTQQDALAAKEAQITAKTNEISALENANPDDFPKTTAPWLTQAKANALTFSSAFRATPQNGAKINVYYKLDKDEDDYYTLLLSFVPYAEYTEEDANTLYKKLVNDLGGANTFVDNIDVFINKDYDPENNGFINIGTFALKNVGSNVNAQIRAISNSDYQVPDKAANDQKIQTAKTALAALQSEKNEIDAYIATIQAEIEGIENNTNPVNTDVTTINNAISSLNGQIEDIDAQINGKDGLNDQITSLTSEINAIQADLKKLTDKDADGKTGLDKLYAAITSAKTAQQTADQTAETKKAAFEQALKDYNDAVENASETALNNYMDVTLTGDITVDNTITNFNGHIEGKNHIISLGNATSVFRTFSGSIVETAINGKFSTANNNAIFNSIANWNGDNTGVYYDPNGARTGNIATLGELGFKARANFGVDFSTGKLVTLSASTKVYDITVYDGPNENTQYYVVCDNTTMNSQAGVVSIKPNTFAKSATNDLNKDINNVFYAQGANFICDNVVIVDDLGKGADNKTIRANFYCPETITASNLTLNRQFNSGANTVCLPFALNQNYTGITAVCTYDLENDNGFQFTSHEGDVPANTPVLLFTNGIENLELSNIKIEKTGENQMTEAIGNNTSESACYGTFKTVNAQEFLGKSKAESIWGLNKGKFQLAGETATFAPFRMVIASEPKNPGLTPAAARRIIIKDEYGDDITTQFIDDNTSGVDDIEMNAPAFSINGGQGEIVINSDAEYGKVLIYTVAGQVAAAAEVTVGTTTVNLPAGVYIVMGQKVMVK